MKEEHLSLKDLIQIISRFLKERRFLLLAAPFAGFLFGYLIDSQLPKKYETNFLIDSPIISNTVLHGVVNNIQTGLKEKQYDKLAQLSAADADVWSSVTSIRSTVLTGEGATNRHKKEVLQVDFELTKPDKAVEAQTAIFTFIKNLPEISQELKAYQDVRVNTIAKIDEEIAQLDSLQSIMLELLKTKKSTLPIGIGGNGSQGDMLLLLQKKNVLLDELNSTGKLKLVTPVFTPSAPSMGPVKSYAIGIALSLFIFFFLAVFLHLRSYARS